MGPSGSQGDGLPSPFSAGDSPARVGRALPLRALVGPYVVRHCWTLQLAERVSARQTRPGFVIPVPLTTDAGHLPPSWEFPYPVYRIPSPVESPIDDVGERAPPFWIFDFGFWIEGCRRSIVPAHPPTKNRRWTIRGSVGRRKRESALRDTLRALDCGGSTPLWNVPLRFRPAVAQLPPCLTPARVGPSSARPSLHARGGPIPLQAGLTRSIFTVKPEVKAMDFW